jgi:hypothetical protein
MAALSSSILKGLVRSSRMQQSLTMSWSHTSKQERGEKEEDRTTGEEETVETRGSSETKTGLTKGATATTIRPPPIPARCNTSSSPSCHKELPIRGELPH